LAQSFGVDADDEHEAESYAIDHNNLTLMGGNFSDFDIAGMWEEEEYTAVLEDLAKWDKLPVSVDGDALDGLLGVGNFQPESAGDQPRLDQKTPVICPHCGENIHNEPEAQATS
jgi:hypothetical protein